MPTTYDLLIVGAGPAGLSSAINGASEGLKVLLVDGASVPGGQARESAAIENYAGFPEGITGLDFMSRLSAQADKFGCEFRLPALAVGLEAEASPAPLRLTDEYGDTYEARSVLLSPGLAYRRLNASRLSSFMGRGAWYGVPVGQTPTSKCDVAVVGGANSAGQAVLNLARNPKATVRLLVRKHLEDQMSTYLIERIRAQPNIVVMEGVEVRECRGSLRLSELCIEASDTGEQLPPIPADFLFIYIGAVPRTHWLPVGLLRDDKGFIRTWEDAGAALPYETSIPGVFAAGDVRSGSTKRIAAAVGEGSAAVSMIHRRLAL